MAETGFHTLLPSRTIELLLKVMCLNKPTILLCSCLYNNIALTLRKPLDSNDSDRIVNWFRSLYWAVWPIHENEPTQQNDSFARRQQTRDTRQHRVTENYSKVSKWYSVSPEKDLSNNIYLIVWLDKLMQPKRVNSANRHSQKVLVRSHSYEQTFVKVI